MKKHILFLITASLLFVFPASSYAEKLHAIAMSGTPKYKKGFTHFDYVNPDAPKGGHLRLGTTGGFDTFNPFLSKGDSASGVGLLYDTLATSSNDEPFTYYGLVAEYMELPEDNTWIRYFIHPSAQFNDGSTVTASDIGFSFDMLTQKGSPMYKKYYNDVIRYEIEDKRTIRFIFKDGKNTELPLILGQIPVLPKSFWKDRDFAKADLTLPLGSGPYVIDKYQAGRSVTFKRSENYWARDLPVNKGQYNFDRVTYEYYRNPSIAMEAFKSGQYDFRQENTAKTWATQYTGPYFDDGLIKKEEIPNQMPQGMQGFGMNTRRSMFKDARVREAIAHAFDFEWTNKNLFYGQYTRTKSYFANSELGASGLPGGDELALLSPYKDKIPPRVFTTPFQPPENDGSGNNRVNLRIAKQLLEEAGWVIQNNKRVNPSTGEVLEFEILLHSPAFERVCQPFVRSLKRLGIIASIRLVDPSQYINRVTSFDFDMMVVGIGQSMSPGNEQRDFFSSDAAGIEGSRNYMGIKDPVVDALIEKIIQAPDRKSLIAATRAMDRVLLWQYFVIPNWHMGAYRIAYWRKFEHPAVVPPYGFSVYTWWIDQAMEAAIDSKLRR